MRIRRQAFEQKISKEVEKMVNESRFSMTRDFIQHGDVSVFVHCICVAYMSCVITRVLNIRVNLSALIVGALLHDYFLYDWHDGELCRKVHGFTHPFKACKNAKEDFELSYLEENIIKRHMFPLVPVPPRYREAWVVCLADKICATEETLMGHCKGRKMEFAKELLDKNSIFEEG
ncbi:MAG: HD domain-containing protein [Lachnospiraceae bacterium]|nr:HD domain-containing protein [Lachnospiraceae bacterium]